MIDTDEKSREELLEAARKRDAELFLTLYRRDPRISWGTAFDRMPDADKKWALELVAKMAKR